MDSYKRYIDDKTKYSMPKVMQQARKQAENEIFKQKVHAHLIIAGAMIVILAISFWW